MSPSRRLGMAAAGQRPARRPRCAVSGRQAFCSCSALTANEVQVIDTATHAFVGSFATGDWAHVLEFTPDGRFTSTAASETSCSRAGLRRNGLADVRDPRTLKVERVSVRRRRAAIRVGPAGRSRTCSSRLNGSTWSRGHGPDLHRSSCGQGPGCRGPVLSTPNRRAPRDRVVRRCPHDLRCGNGPPTTVALVDRRRCVPGRHPVGDQPARR